MAALSLNGSYIRTSMYVLCALQSLSEKLLGLTSENIHRKEEQVSWGGRNVVAGWTNSSPGVSSRCFMLPFHMAT